MGSSLVPMVAAGLLLGMKHALDADHLAAVGVLASEHHGWRKAAAVGALWGLGHTLALAAVGVALLGAGVALPPEFARWAEGLVAATLVWLGARSLWSLARGDTIHFHAHRHGSWWHVHPHHHRRGDAHGEPDSHHGPSHARPFLFGMLHGLAGSAALFLLVLTSEPRSVFAWAYLAAFGAGSTLSMTAFSALVALPFQLRPERLQRWHGRLRAFAALCSIAVGLVLGYELAASA